MSALSVQPSQQPHTAGLAHVLRQPFPESRATCIRVSVAKQQCIMRHRDRSSATACCLILGRHSIIHQQTFDVRRSTESVVVTRAWFQRRQLHGFPAGDVADCAAHASAAVRPSPRAPTRLTTPQCFRCTLCLRRTTNCSSPLVERPDECFALVAGCVGGVGGTQRTAS